MAQAQTGICASSIHNWIRGGQLTAHRAKKGKREICHISLIDLERFRLTEQAGVHRNVATVVMLSDLSLNPNYQMRVGVSQSTVQEYFDRLIGGSEAPPIWLASIPNAEGEELVVVDGFHRYYAYLKAEREAIPAIVFRCLNEAEIFDIAATSNLDHGLKLSAKDRRRQLQEMLRRPIYAEMPTRQLAQHSGVSHNTVARYRRMLLAGESMDGGGRKPEASAEVQMLRRMRALASGLAAFHPIAAAQISSILNDLKEAA